MPRLVSVDELTLLLERYEILGGSLPLISDALWTSFNPRLRKLNYRGTIEAFQRILSPLLQHNFDPLPSLTHLVIYFQFRSMIPSVNHDIAVFVTFLQCLEQTLESLFLIPAQLTSIVLKLPHFPRLEHLSIRLYVVTPEEGVAFTSFVSTHREQLKTLTLSLCSTQIYQDLCNVSFPFLHTLVLDLQDPTVLTHAFPHVPCLQRFVSGGRYYFDQETMKKIRDRASPSEPTIAYERHPFGLALDIQLGAAW